jgi:hypothetical protein
LGAFDLGERIVAVGLLTQREVELLGNGFSRLWPVDKTPCFTDLVKAIDDADEELMKAHDLKCEQAIRNES